jgi:hypothetical protein
VLLHGKNSAPTASYRNHIANRQDRSCCGRRREGEGPFCFSLMTGRAPPPTRKGNGEACRSFGVSQMVFAGPMTTPSLSFPPLLPCATHTHGDDPPPGCRLIKSFNPKRWPTINASIDLFRLKVVTLIIQSHTSRSSLWGGPQGPAYLAHTYVRIRGGFKMSPTSKQRLLQRRPPESRATHRATQMTMMTTTMMTTAPQ